MIQGRKKQLFANIGTFRPFQEDHKDSRQNMTRKSKLCKQKNQISKKKKQFTLLKTIFYISELTQSNRSKRKE